ncbi:hypothetical protein MJO28_013564, partial [Puccinia striiformis f. sp. tritici]
KIVPPSLLLQLLLKDDLFCFYQNWAKAHGYTVATGHSVCGENLTAHSYYAAPHHPAKRSPTDVGTSKLETQSVNFRDNLMARNDEEQTQGMHLLAQVKEVGHLWKFCSDSTAAPYSESQYFGHHLDHIRRTPEAMMSGIEWQKPDQSASKF